MSIKKRKLKYNLDGVTVTKQSAVGSKQPAVGSQQKAEGSQQKAEGRRQSKPLPNSPTPPLPHFPSSIMLTRQQNDVKQLRVSQSPYIKHLEHNFIQENSQESTLTRLTQSELKTLTDCEASIEKGLRTFFDIGEALKIIIQNKLFRSRFKSANDYCRKRWQINPSTAYKLIRTFDTYQNIKTNIETFDPDSDTNYDFIPEFYDLKTKSTLNTKQLMLKTLEHCTQSPILALSPFPPKTQFIIFKRAFNRAAKFNRSNNTKKITAESIYKAQTEIFFLLQNKNEIISTLDPYYSPAPDEYEKPEPHSLNFELNTKEIKNLLQELSSIENELKEVNYLPPEIRNKKSLDFYINTRMQTRKRISTTDGILSFLIEDSQPENQTQETPQIQQNYQPEIHSSQNQYPDPDSNCNSDPDPDPDPDPDQNQYPNPTQNSELKTRKPSTYNPLKHYSPSPFHPLDNFSRIFSEIGTLSIQYLPQFNFPQFILSIPDPTTNSTHNINITQLLESLNNQTIRISVSANL